MNGGSVYLIRVSIVTKAFALVLMALILASRSLILQVVDSSRRLGAWSLGQGDHPFLLVSSPSNSWVRLHDSDFDETGLLSRLKLTLVDRGRRFLEERAWLVLWWLWDSQSPERQRRWDRLTSETGATRGGRLFVARCRAGIIFVHDPDLFGDPIHLTVEALKIQSLSSVAHWMSSVI